MRARTARACAWKRSRCGRPHDVQLIGLFKRTTGLTPHAYLTQIRLGIACRHLRRGLPIAEVAAVAGFLRPRAR